MNKVLMISYYFPPCGGPGSIRTTKFVKYLRDYNWEPVVLTVKGADYHAWDASLSNEIPAGIQIYRTIIPEPYYFYRKLTGKKSTEPVDVATVPGGHRNKKSLKERFAEDIRATFFIPDARIGWLPFALKKGLQIIKQQQIKILYTSAPPFTCHLIGYFLKRMTKLPWVADFRDPWTQSYFYPSRPIISRRLEEKVEKKVVQNADRVISVNDQILNDLKEKYNLNDHIKWIAIPNGFDPSDFKNVSPIQDDAFTIVYTGSLNEKMSPENFLKAVGLLCSEQEDFSTDVKLIFVGRFAQNISYLFDDNRLKDKIQLLPHLPHKESLKYVCGADLLLLLIPESKGNEVIMTTKIFEYIRSNRAILLLADRGEAAQLIQSLRWGFAVSSANIEAIKTQLWEIYQLWKSGQLSSKSAKPPQFIFKFERKYLTEKLATVFRDVI